MNQVRAVRPVSLRMKQGQTLPTAIQSASTSAQPGAALKKIIFSVCALTALARHRLCWYSLPEENTADMSPPFCVELVVIITCLEEREAIAIFASSRCFCTCTNLLNANMRARAHTHTNTHTHTHTNCLTTDHLWRYGTEQRCTSFRMRSCSCPWSRLAVCRRHYHFKPYVFRSSKCVCTVQRYEVC
jgi:hypothetical protein